MKIATECICCGSKELDSWKAEVMPFVAWRTFAQLYEYGGDFDEDRKCHSLRCRDCGVTFLDWRYSDNEILRLYDGYRNEEYVASREMFEPGYRMRQLGFSGRLHYIPQVEEFLLPFLSPDNIVTDWGTDNGYYAPHYLILDWGGGSGINTPFRETSADVFDISGVQPEYGRLIDKPGKYDLIVFANVIEHTPDPARELERIKKHMRGVLYIEVSLDDATDKKRWHEHINIFTEKSLIELVTRCKLNIVDMKLLNSPPYHPFLMAVKL
jgi:hypothetical protein